MSAEVFDQHASPKPGNGRWSRSLAPFLLPLVLLAAFVLRVSDAMRSPTLIHPDEVFQTQEPAHRLAYGYGGITWEWRQGVRSWVFPAFLALVMRATDWTSTGSAGYLRGIEIALLTISLSAVWFGYAWAKRAGGLLAALAAAIACAAWPEMVEFAPRALNEVVAAHILLPGLYLGVYGTGLRERKRLFLAGVLCGLAVSLRVQLLPVVVFSALYFCCGKWRERVPMVAAGILLPLCLFGAVDWVTWSHPFQSFYLYFWINLVEGRSAIYGTQPWYWYVVQLLQHLGPLAILALAGIRRSPFLGWTAFILLLSHSVIPHKEMRFLYPLLPILMTLAGLGFAEIVQTISSLRKTLVPSSAVAVTSLLFLVLTSGLFAGFIVRAWAQYVHRPNSGGMAAFDRISRDPAVCGVGLYGLAWFETGGYTHLHRNIPIMIFRNLTTLERDSQSFDALVTQGTAFNLSNGFTVSQCWSGACLYTRGGACTPSSKTMKSIPSSSKTGN